MAHVRMEESKLNEDALRYSIKIDKAKKRISWMKNNLGNPEAFLQ